MTTVRDQAPRRTTGQGGEAGQAGQMGQVGRGRRYRVRGGRFALSAWAAAALGGGLVACDQVSEETRDAAVVVGCSQIEVDSGEIAENPEQARLVALIVRDFAPEENIRNLAAQVAEDPNALNPRAQLADYVNDKCGR